MVWANGNFEVAIWGPCDHFSGHLTDNINLWSLTVATMASRDELAILRLNKAN